MKNIRFVIVLLLSGFFASSQNDQDALRYSFSGTNGTSRFNAMGGAFGAVGADVSCAAYNPAGLAIFRKGELSYSGAVRINQQTLDIYGNSSSLTRSYINFNNFGFAAPWKPEDERENRNVFSLTVSQPLNLYSTRLISGYTNSSSIARDMLNIARQKGNTLLLNNSYEGLGFDTYVLDTADNNFFSNVDIKRSVLQTRKIETSGRVNDINISFAHSHKDKYYIGASLGIPQLRYESTTTHTERDDKDSMRVILTSPKTYTTTYIDGLPVIDTTWLGFDNLTYTEYFKTSGGGFNIKIGGVVRVDDVFRLGAYYHSATYYSLTDAYYNSMEMAFDRSKANPIKKTYPSTQGGGYFNYKLITPSRFGISAAFIINKTSVIAVDYENINYGSSRLQSDNPSDFSGVNSLITHKYKGGHNLRIGAELNVKPLMCRIGYNMQGSPYGKIFKGDLVRNTFTAGVGFRTGSGFYFDFAFLNSYFFESYFLFTTLSTKALIKSSNNSLAVTVGLKF